MCVCGGGRGSVCMCGGGRGSVCVWWGGGVYMCGFVSTDYALVYPAFVYISELGVLSKPIWSGV